MNDWTFSAQLYICYDFHGLAALIDNNSVFHDLLGWVGGVGRWVGSV